MSKGLSSFLVVRLWDDTEDLRDRSESLNGLRLGLFLPLISGIGL